MLLRWGIISAGKISHDFAVALYTLPKNEHKLVAVAARDKKRAEEFAKRHGIPVAYGSYEELATSTVVDVVYVGALNPQHFEIGMLLLKNGKHVLMEKPLCLNEKQAQQLITYAKSQKLFLMEGLWSRFFPAYERIREQVGGEAMGIASEVIVNLGLNLAHVDRLQKKELGGGTILDLGVYTIQFAQWIYEEEPILIKATGELNEQGVDVNVKAELRYTQGRIAKFEISGKKELDNTAIVKGPLGQILVRTFWCPTTIIDVDKKEKFWLLPTGRMPTNFPNSEGLRYEAEEVRKCIMEGKLESEKMCHNESIIMARIEDELRKQVGVFYKED